eukprot:TRINITY_DN1852_c0_g1_i1.p1 TRINITY_DN1852_c0_g1~~TRINITY_DN1852_c0_g1_i1.p1  ORF type:complete len:521 (+),score=147.91 TRINITY_DN1852_c0_g1_i1:47-1609(+)
MTEAIERGILEQRVAPSNVCAFIDGQFIQSCASSNGGVDVVNPATERLLLRLPSATADHVERAVNAASKAFRDGRGTWPALTGTQRAAYLLKIAEIVKQRKDFLGKLESLDCGKPLKESLWDVDDVAGCFEYFSEQAKLLDGKQDQVVDVGMEAFKCTLRYEPTGVVAAVIPWNYPFLMAAWKVAPALAAGCTVILKPSEVTPLTALELADIIHQAGVPAGVFNLLIGDGRIGTALINHPKVDKIGFTGSVPTGSKIMESAAKRVCNVCLELGGKSPFIIFDDVDITAAVEWAMFGCFWTNGQICSSTSRVLVHEKIADKFFERLAKEAKAIPIANPLLPEFADATGIIGPSVNAGQHQKVLGYIEGAIKEGAVVLAGGKKSKKYPSGYYVEPTVLKVTPQMTVWKEEIFGPVMSVLTFKTEEEAIALANDSDFGLASAVMSRDAARCQRVVRAMRAGIAWINCSQPCFVQMPWGGLKKSGIGRELGSQGIFNYLEPKQVTSYVSKDPWGWYIKPASAKL